MNDLPEPIGVRLEKAVANHVDNMDIKTISSIIYEQLCTFYRKEASHEELMEFIEENEA